MDVRAGTVLAAIPLLISSACGPHVAAVRESNVSKPVATTTPSVPTDSPYTVAPAGLASVATSFVRDVCSYRAAVESATDFVVRASEVATPAEVARLAASQRARLNWPALRMRRESASVAITGATQVGQSEATANVVVEFVRTTRTDFAVVSEFAQMSLGLVETSAGIRVSAAEGACL